MTVREKAILTGVTGIQREKWRQLNSLHLQREKNKTKAKLNKQTNKQTNKKLLIYTAISINVVGLKSS